MVMHFFFIGGGGKGVNKVHYGLCETKISTMRGQAVISGVQYYKMARAFWTLLSNLFGELLVFCSDSHLINPFYCLFIFVIQCRSFFSFTSIWTIS